MLNYLNTDEVIDFNKLITNNNSNVKNLSLVDSAVNNLKAGAFSQEFYPTIIEKSAILFYSLCLNHGFHDGNKRTANIFI